MPLLEELVAKRAEVARILGYDSMSKYVLEERMAKKPENVERFQEELFEKIKAKGKQELDELVKLKRDETGDAEAEMMPWDRMFYANL